MPTLTGAVRSCLLLVAACALVLKAADHLPALVAGTPHGARVYRTLAAAEAGIGARIWVPASCPPAIEWPPSRVDVWPGPPVSVAVRLQERSNGRNFLILVQSIGARAQPPDALLEPAENLMTADVPIGGHSATMSRGLAPDGQLLHDLSWDQGGRHLVLRYSGPVEDLLAVAASLERIRP